MFDVTQYIPEQALTVEISGQYKLEDSEEDSEDDTIYPPHPMEQDHTYSAATVHTVIYYEPETVTSYPLQGKMTAVLSSYAGLTSLQKEQEDTLTMPFQCPTLPANTMLPSPTVLPGLSTNKPPEAQQAALSKKRETLISTPASKPSSNKFRCRIEGCERQKPFTSAYNLWDHMISQHTTITYIDNRAKTLHQIGEAILGEAGLIQCCLTGCSAEPFTRFADLGNHLKSSHLQALDAQPFNDIWANKMTDLGLQRPEIPRPANTSDQKFFEMLDDKPYRLLSTMEGFYLGKKYQTRHGKGFACHYQHTDSQHTDSQHTDSQHTDSVHAEVPQTPEGLGRHWHFNHCQHVYACDIKPCSKASSSPWTYFKDFLNHILATHEKFSPAEFKNSIKTRRHTSS